MADPDFFESGGFEDLAEINGNTLWSARDLSRVLGYATYESFSQGPVAKAMTACVAAGIPYEENFQIDQHLRLTRFACFLVAMNADPKKPQVAKAQAYFAAIAESLVRLTSQDEVERVYIRGELTGHLNDLNATAKSHGVENYARFTNSGYRGMYNMDIRMLRSLKGVPKKRSPLDFMGSRELTANLFRIKETDAKIERDQIYGQSRLENAAHKVGTRVREFMHETNEQYPEELQPASDIKGSLKQLKHVQREFRQLDQGSNGKVIE